MQIGFFLQAEDGIRGGRVTGVQTCALPIYSYNNTPSLTVYDSLGAAHTASLYFVKGAAANSWSSYLYIDGAAVNAPPGAALDRSEERRVGKEWRTRRRTAQR